MVLEFSAGDACSDCVIANSLLRVSFIIFGEATIATLETPNPRESKTAQTKINETHPLPFSGLCVECSAEYVNRRPTAIPFVV